MVGRPELAEVPSATELRRQVRAWRRTRAELSVWQVVEDAYVAVLSIAVLGAMAGSVVLGLRDMGDVACAGTCAAVRSLAPWPAALLLVALLLALARLLGPVFVPPAAGPWLLATPVDRGDLLRPSLVRALGLPALVAPLLLVPVVVLAGLPPLTGALVTLAGASASVAVVAHAAYGQVHAGHPSRWVARVVTSAVWLLVAWAALAPRTLPAAGPDNAVTAGVGLLALGVAVAYGLRTLRRLDRTSRAALARTEDAWPSLSGALASMDLTLLHDVLLSRRWAVVASLRVRRGGPRGWWVLVHRDLVRAVRAPQPWLIALGSLMLPFALARAGLVHGIVVASALVGFGVGIGLSSGLRVLARTPTLARMLPYRGWQVRLAQLVLPATAMVLLGAACAWALLDSVAPGTAALLGAVVVLASLAATARWLCSPPPDYGSPLLSTPAGGLPPSVVLAWGRGFDVWAACSLLVLLDTRAAWVALLVALGVLAHALTKE
jgi:hypothetical protein